MTKIAFIGGGNMATSIIGGLMAKGRDNGTICVSDPFLENRQHLQQLFNVNTESNNADAVADANIIVLAVKPQVMKKVCNELRGQLPDEVLIISIAAGIPMTQLTEWLGEACAIVRCMPNTPALVQAGATGAVANASVTAEQKSHADSILTAVGIVEWLEDEALIDSVTAVSGSAPAYFFLLLEAMVSTAEKQGLPASTARNLAVQTCIGAGLLAQKDTSELQELRRRVTSPGGTTERAIQALQRGHFEKIVADAMDACLQRSRELAKQV